MSNITIRRVGHEAASLLAELHRCCFIDARFGEPWDERAMAEVLAMPGVSAFVAEVGGTPGGLAIGRVAADEAEILTLGVHPGRRRGGLGRALTEAIAETAVDAGAGVLVLEVGEANAAARALYAGLGFAEAGYRRGYYAPRSAGLRAETALVMRRSLTTVDENIGQEQAGLIQPQ